MKPGKFKGFILTYLIYEETVLQQQTEKGTATLYMEFSDHKAENDSYK
jgi:hypothetical protein